MATFGANIELLRSSGFVVSALVLALSFGGFYGFAELLPFVLIEEIGLSTFGFAMVMLIQTGAFITGNVLASFAVSRLSGARIVQVSLG
ncbi:MAG: hypothetical protein MO852_07660 [Candidatus Devosia euplotis]|nr:hypothetical protein [Candidatus Devosia euplotis]